MNWNRYVPRLILDSFAAQWAVLCAGLLTLSAVAGVHLYAGYDDICALERNLLEAHAKIVSENLGHQLGGTKRMLTDIREDLSFWKKQNDNQGRSVRRLQTMSDVMPGVHTILILDVEGTATTSNRKELIGQNFSSRDYFLAPKHAPNSNVLYVSSPFKTALGVFTMNVAIGISGPEGQFAGIIAAILAPDYFETLLNSVRYVPDISVSLIHGDGELILLVPARPEVETLNLAQPGSFFTRHREGHQQASVMTGDDPITGEKSLSALRTIHPEGLSMDKPLVVSTTRSLTAIYATWRQHLYSNGALFAGTSLIASLLLLCHKSSIRAVWIGLRYV